MDISRTPAFDAQAALNLQPTSSNHPKLAESFLEQLHAVADTDAPASHALADENGVSQGQESQFVDELQEKFRQFVGNTLYGQMLKSMRNTIGKPAYMHGGRTEEVFQQQLDQIMVEDLTKKSAATIADPMFELFNNQRRS